MRDFNGILLSLVIAELIVDLTAAIFTCVFACFGKCGCCDKYERGNILYWLYVLSCHLRFSQWIHTLQLPECQVTPCSKQVRNLKFKLMQLDSSPQLHTAKCTVQISTQNTGQLFGQLVKLFSVRLWTKWLWLWVQAQSFHIIFYLW